MISNPIILSEEEARRLVLEFYSEHLGQFERETFKLLSQGASATNILSAMADALRERDSERERNI